MSCTCYFCNPTRKSRPETPPKCQLTPKERVLKQQKARLMEAEENSKPDPENDARHAAHRERILAKRRAEAEQAASTQKQSMLAPTLATAGLAATSSAVAASEEDNDDDLDDEMELKWLTVPEGQLTFNSEGNDIDDHFLFTRTPHIPHDDQGNVFDNSGITIGRGLDVGSRDASEIEDLFNQAALHAKPISPALLTWLKGAANKRRQAGYEYWKTLDDKVPKAEQEITRKMQHHLFNVVYAEYITNTKKTTTKQDVCDTYLNSKKIDWDALPQNVKDVLVDLTYRGDYTGTEDPRGNTRKSVVPAVYQDQIEGNSGAGSKLHKVISNSKLWLSSFNVDDNRYQRRITHLK
ncbi:pesticin C-terminus-like muramidase [uncultured Shewanella sp.]|uniref:pesticin C-terminus-like muramidase n=1 Tax=uncultured Shewanella sp. TaxID=173975 RepID=UPI00262C9200|nr:pesticin C-terminus-like muramidase [uncultured Shewanella sp.]